MVTDHLAAVLRRIRCPFQQWFGIRCPMCGTGDSVLHFAGGRWGAAFASNPFFLVYLAVTLLCVLDSVEYTLSGTSNTVGRRVIRGVDSSAVLLRGLALLSAVSLAYQNWFRRE